LSIEIALTDKEVVERIVRGGKDFEDTAMFLFHRLKKFITEVKHKLNLPQQQLQDAYADSLIELIRQIKDGSFRGEQTLAIHFDTLFYDKAFGIYQKKAFKNQHEPARKINFDKRERELLHMVNQEDEETQVVNVISEMGALCQRILKDWGYYGYSMVEIAHRSELSDELSAKNMKQKCLKNLRSLLNAKMYNV